MIYATYVCDWCSAEGPSTDDLGKGKHQMPDNWKGSPDGAMGECLCPVCWNELELAIVAAKALRKGRRGK